MTNVPLITIGITCYNAEDTIFRAIRSALAQDWPHCEIVAVDDGSSDGTAAIVESFRPQGVRVVRLQDNQGVAAARARIVGEAKGDFIAFFDDDDESLPTRLSRQYARIAAYEARHPEAKLIVCHTARRQLYPDGARRIERTMGTDESKTAPHGPDVARRILYGRALPGGFGACAACSQMARRSLYETAGGFDHRFRRGEDTDLNIRIALQGGHFVGIDEPLVVQTMTLTGDKHLARERALVLALVDKYRDFLIAEGQYDFTRAWFDLKFDLLESHTGLFLRKLLRLAAAHPVKAARRILWTLPNVGFSLRQRAFHRAGAA
jgi:GT2 family glycosyltransferase